MSSRSCVRRIVGGVVGSVFVVFLSVNSLAQSNSALRGTVYDPTGDVIRDVSITLRDRSIGYERNVETDHDGSYQIIGLAAGTYQIQVRVSGFSTQTIDEIAVDTGRTV